jgi:hypothetical protein
MLKRIGSVCALLTLLLCAQAAQACTVTAAVNSFPPWASFHGYDGYSGQPPFGSISGAGLSGGRTITTVLQIFNQFAWTLTLRISGFTSDPGYTYFSSFTLAGTNYFPQASPAYSYSGGTATWTFAFPGGYLGQAMQANQSYLCSVNF